MNAKDLEQRYLEAMYEFGQLSMRLRELDAQRAELKAAVQRSHENCIGLNGALTAARSADAAPVPTPASKETPNGSDS